jgi:sugar lactone lactonase YvrE
VSGEGLARAVTVATVCLLLGSMVSDPPASARSLGMFRHRIATIAGDGRAVSRGDGGPATKASLHGPRDTAIGPDGSLYIADTWGNRIRKIDRLGTITSIAGTGVAGYGGDDGPATQAMLNMPHDVAVDAQGVVFVADSGNHRIRMIDTSGIITTVAGTGVPGYRGDGGPATAARLQNPKSVALFGGNLYIADSVNDRIREVDASGIITTVAGTGTAGYGGDGGPALRAQLDVPQRIAFDSLGNLYIADSLNDRIREVDTSGIITTVAGTGAAGYGGDGGPAVQAMFDRPRGIAVDQRGDIYVADSENDRVRRINPAGIVTTIAGTGVAGFSGDGGPARDAEFHNPRGLTLDRRDRLIIADTFNNRIRQVVLIPHRHGTLRARRQMVVPSSWERVGSSVTPPSGSFRQW